MLCRWQATQRRGHQCSRGRCRSELWGVVRQAGAKGQVAVVGLAALCGHVIACLAQRSAGAAAGHASPWPRRLSGGRARGQVLEQGARLRYTKEGCQRHGDAGVCGQADGGRVGLAASAGAGGAGGRRQLRHANCIAFDSARIAFEISLQFMMQGRGAHFSLGELHMCRHVAKRPTSPEAFCQLLTASALLAADRISIAAKNRAAAFILGCGSAD